MRIKNIVVPKQPSESQDCGIYTLKYAETILSNDMSKIDELKTSSINVLRKYYAIIISKNVKNRNLIPKLALV